MKPRALICDVYNTLLRVGPPPPDAPQRWDLLWRSFFSHPPPLSLLQVSLGASDRIATSHQAALRIGIVHPEVWWPDILRSVLPELARLARGDFDRFVHAHMRLGRTLELLPHAAETLLLCQRHGLHLGIASNAQAYTLVEVDELLAPAGASLSLFHPDLRAWSFQLGFSKPNPHFLRTLAARLHALGISPCETLMVGDRHDNDIQPALVQGWQAWQLGPRQPDSPTPSGPWPDLARHLQLTP